MSRTRRRLRASPPGSTSWVYIDDDRSLVVEFYDHGKEAEASFGHDVAFLLRVAPDRKRPLLDLLRTSPASPPRRKPLRATSLRRLIHRGNEETLDDLDLLDELEERFGHYAEVRKWFDANGVPYEHEFDSWA